MFVENKNNADGAYTVEILDGHEHSNNKSARQIREANLEEVLGGSHWRRRAGANGYRRDGGRCRRTAGPQARRLALGRLAVVLPNVAIECRYITTSLQLHNVCIYIHVGDRFRVRETALRFRLLVCCLVDNHTYCIRRYIELKVIELY